MSKNKITLKNLKVSESQSEETIAYTAIICLNGKEICHAKNSGKGGADIYLPVKGKNRTDIKNLEEIAKAKVEELNAEICLCNLDYTIALEYFIAELVEETNIVKKRQSKKLILKKDGNIYDTPLLNNLTITKFKNPKGVAFLKAKIQNLENQGYEILNTNLSFVYA